MITSAYGKDVDAKIPDGSITTQKLADGAITCEKLSPELQALLCVNSCKNPEYLGKVSGDRNEAWMWVGAQGFGSKWYRLTITENDFDPEGAIDLELSFIRVFTFDDVDYDLHVYASDCTTLIGESTIGRLDDVLIAEDTIDITYDYWWHNDTTDIYLG
jgi:hypothetical protein